MKRILSAFLAFLTFAQSLWSTFDDTVLACYFRAHPSVMRQYFADIEDPQFAGVNFELFLQSVVSDSEKALFSMESHTNDPCYGVWKSLLEKQKDYALNPRSEWNFSEWQLECEYLLTQSTNFSFPNIGNTVILNDVFQMGVLLGATRVKHQNFVVKMDDAERWIRQNIPQNTFTKQHQPYAPLQTAPLSKHHLLSHLYKAWWDVFGGRDKSDPSSWSHLFQAIYQVQVDVRGQLQRYESNMVDLNHAPSQYDVTLARQQLTQGLETSHTLLRQCDELISILTSVLPVIQDKAREVLKGPSLPTLPAYDDSRHEPNDVGSSHSSTEIPALIGEPLVVVEPVHPPSVLPEVSSDASTTEAVAIEASEPMPEKVPAEQTLADHLAEQKAKESRDQRTAQITRQELLQNENEEILKAYAKKINEYCQKSDDLLNRMRKALDYWTKTSGKWSNDGKTALKPKQNQLASFVSNLRKARDENTLACRDAKALKKGMPYWENALNRAERALDESREVFNQLQAEEKEAKQKKLLPLSTLQPAVPAATPTGHKNIHVKEATAPEKPKTVPTKKLLEDLSPHIDKAAKAEKARLQREKDEVELKQARDKLDSLMPSLDQAIVRFNELATTLNSLKKNPASKPLHQKLDRHIDNITIDKDMLCTDRERSQPKRTDNTEALKKIHDTLSIHIEESTARWMQYRLDVDVLRGEIDREEMRIQCLKPVSQDYAATAVVLCTALDLILTKLNGTEPNSKFTKEEQTQLRLAGNQLHVDSYSRFINQVKQEIMRMVNAILVYDAEEVRERSCEILKMLRSSAEVESLKCYQALTSYYFAQIRFYQDKYNDLFSDSDSDKREYKVQINNGLFVSMTKELYEKYLIQQLNHLTQRSEEANTMRSSWLDWKNKVKLGLVFPVLCEVVDPELRHIVRNESNEKPSLLQKLIRANEKVDSIIYYLKSKPDFKEVATAHDKMNMLACFTVAGGDAQRADIVCLIKRIQSSFAQNMPALLPKLGEHAVVVQDWWQALQEALPPVLDGLAAYPPVQKLMLEVKPEPKKQRK